MSMVYANTGPRVPNAYADVDWDAWDRPPADRVEAALDWFDPRGPGRLVVPLGAPHIAFLVLEHAGRGRRVTQDKHSVTWERVKE